MGKNNTKLTTEEFIGKARKVHGDKYNYSKVVYVNNHTKVCIICPIHGEFWQVPTSHLVGSGCPKCAGKERLTTEEFIKKAMAIHGDKYDYSKVEYVNNQTKVCIICQEHGEFWQTPINHLKGKGCPDCYGNRKSNKEKFIEKAREIHGGKYDYSKVEYMNTDIPVCIICPEHGEFLQTPYHHIRRKQGCPKCGGRVRLTTEEFIKRAIEIHGNKYDYSKVEYINNQTPVCIICPEHGEFWQKPSKHLIGQKCSSCLNSILEEKTAGVLEKNGIKYRFRARFKWLGLQHLDFFLPDYNIAIECQGEQHYHPVDFAGKGDEWAKIQHERIKQLDTIKLNKCIENKIDLFYIKYNVKDIEKFILKRLKK